MEVLETKMNKIPKLQEAGSALVLAVLAIVLLALTGMALLILSFQTRILAIRTNQGIQALWAADAGVYKAIDEMNKELKAKTWLDDSMPMATNEALLQTDQSFSYKVTKDGSGTYTVTSIGTTGPITKQVSATMHLRGLFEYAIITQEAMSFKADTTLDAYNSNDASKTDVDMQIATTSTSDDQMILNMNVNINGDVLVGVGGDPNTVIKDTGATTGDRSALTVEPEFVTITPPDLPSKGALDVQGTTLAISPADSGEYPSITLATTLVGLGDDVVTTPAVLQVSGGDVVMYITGDVDLGSSCEIIIAADSSLTIYSDGDIVCKNGSNIGYQGSPEEPDHLKIYGTSTTTQKFDIMAKSDWSGVVYAPEADVVLRAKGDFYGSFGVKSFDLMAGGNFYYDEALKSNQTVGDEGVRFEVARWQDG